jgi:eukaryotic-like serine/threonine-protein kinase
MKAEALIGRALGTCTLQKLVGQGGMGAVFLAQQSRPRRQVAVKVLLPITQLNANQLAAFLERFRRETDAAASLEHPNIMPVHEYGEQDGIAYLVMPYVSGGTLRDEMEREGPLSLQKTVDYLEQLSSALDFAHERGVIHRDIKPANIMVTNEGRLILSDFGLVKIIAAGQMPQMRLTGAGAPVGTPDYMAPEQVIGEEIDTRADLYSLGVILFQMLTGTTPFQGETPMQIAAQHLQIPPPSPQMLRPDLPIAAEQVVLQSMAKRPGDRYMRAQEMARAFRFSLMHSGIQLDPEHNWAGLMSGSTASRLAVHKGQFDPIRQTISVPKVTKADISASAQEKAANQRQQVEKNPYPVPGAMPTAQNNIKRPGTGLLSRSGMLPSMNAASPGLAPTGQQAPKSGLLPKTGGGLLSKTGQFPMVSTAMPGNGLHPGWGQEAPPAQFSANTALQRNPTNALMTQEQVGPSTTLKLNDPVKVVKIPVAGQPGRYITGILPFERQDDDDEPAAPRKTLKPWMRKTLAIVVIVIILTSLGILTAVESHNQLNPQQTSNQTTSQVSANSSATKATATASANILVSDPLDRNINNWLTQPTNRYTFKDGAYHISVNAGQQGDGVVLPGKSFNVPLTYTLTMQEIKGDDTTIKNTFGMIMRFNQQNKNGQIKTTFYTFEVQNVKGKNYQFWRYDDNKTHPWTLVSGGEIPMGKEFHQGKASNTIAITMNGSTFTTVINGTKLSKVVHDTTFTSGGIGMIVNNAGTEVAFKNLLVTRQ